jgi:O-antigen ligase
MWNLAVTRHLEKLILLTLLLVTLFVSPWNMVEPNNLPKLALLIFASSVSGSLTFLNTSFFKRKTSRTLLITLGIFCGLLLVNLFTSNLEFSFRFFGAPGRNTGALAYFCFSILLLSVTIISGQQFLKKYISTLFLVGAILSLYGLGQFFGFEIFDYVNVYGSNVFGTFGNPNFQSAFMGIVGAAATVYAFFGDFSWQMKTGLAALASISLLNVRLSSEQGFFAYLAGISAGLLFYLFSKKKKLMGVFGLATSALAVVAVALGIFNKGPLAEFLFKASLEARGFYWSAAVKMMAENPITGVGLDGFGDQYRRYRSEESVQFGAGLFADSAHNIPLDLAAGGGFPLLLAYLGLTFLAILSIIRILKRGHDFNPVFASVVAAWVAYQAQSLISINQIGLGIWGWSLTGLLIGYELNTRETIVEFRKSLKDKPQDLNVLPPSVVLLSFAAGLVGLILSLPPYIGATKFYNGLQSGDAEIIQKSAYLEPYDRTRFLGIAQILKDNKLESKAIQVLSDASKLYPDNFELWQMWAGVTSATPEQIARAKAELKRLDPFNPNLK